MSKIRIMLSSRCETEIKAEKRNVTLSILRKELKEQIEAEKLFDKEFVCRLTWLTMIFWFNKIIKRFDKLQPHPGLQICYIALLPRT